MRKGNLNQIIYEQKLTKTKYKLEIIDGQLLTQSINEYNQLFSNIFFLQMLVNPNQCQSINKLLKNESSAMQKILLMYKLQDKEKNSQNTFQIFALSLIIHNLLQIQYTLNFIGIFELLQSTRMENLNSPSVTQIILLSVAAFVLFQSYKYILIPYIKVTQKRREIKGKYQAYQFPFTPYGFSFILKMVNDFKQFGDSLHSRKHVFPKKDLTVSTMNDHLLITLINPKLVHDFFERQKEGCYAKVKTGIHLSSLFQILSTGLLLSEGQEWRYKRKIMSSLFNFQFIKEKTKMIIDISKEMCEQIKKQKNQKGQVEIKVGALFRKIFGTVVVRCFFGDVKLNDINGKSIFEFLSNLLQKIANRNLMVSSFVLSPFLKRLGIRKIDRQINEGIGLYREYIRQVINYIIECVNQGRIPQDQEGLVAKLIRNKQLVKESSWQEKIEKGYYTYDDLTNQLCTFFFAGTDTTSNLVASLIHILAKYKNVEENLREQIKNILSDDAANINLENIKKMTYLKNVQSEILRLMPPAPTLLQRETLKDHKIGDLTIQKGTIVNLEIVTIHYNQDIYEKPFQFNPQRWEKLQNSPNITQFYFPFSIGFRSCIGQQLALVESRVALIVFLLNFKNGRQLQPLRTKFSLTYGPQNDNKICFINELIFSYKLIVSLKRQKNIYAPIYQSFFCL